MDGLNMRQADEAVEGYAVWFKMSVMCSSRLYCIYLSWCTLSETNPLVILHSRNGKNGQLTHSPIIQAISLHTLVHTYCSRRRQPLQMITKPDARKPRVSQDDFAVFPSDSIGALAPIGRLHLSTDMATTISLSLDSEPHGARSRLPLLPTYIAIGQPRLRDSSLRRPSL
jgi:hypothetical protein